MRAILSWLWRAIQLRRLRHEYKLLGDDWDHYQGVIAGGRNRLAKLERDQRWRMKRLEEIGRKINSMDQPKAILAQAMRVQED